MKIESTCLLYQDRSKLKYITSTAKFDIFNLYVRLT